MSACVLAALWRGFAHKVFPLTRTILMSPELLTSDGFLATRDKETLLCHV